MPKRAKNGRKNAIDLLKQDHEHVKGLLEKLSETTERGVKTREKLFEEIFIELEVHAQIEEELLYPEFHRRAENRDDEKMFFEARDEHALVRQIELPALRDTSISSVEFAARARVVKDLVEHHVEEEESEMFPRIKQLFSQEELIELGERMKARKEQILATKKAA